VQAAAAQPPRRAGADTAHRRARGRRRRAPDLPRRALCETAAVDAEVNARCGAAYGAGNRLASLFNSANVKLATKVLIFLALVQSRLLYEAETLAGTAKHLRCRTGARPSWC
jgi:hypothetical protein